MDLIVRCKILLCLIKTDIHFSHWNISIYHNSKNGWVIADYARYNVNLG